MPDESIAVAIGRVLVSDSPFQREKRQKVPNVLKAEQIRRLFGVSESLS
jgi:hypothetical protein